MGLVKNLQLEKQDLEEVCARFLMDVDYYGPNTDVHECPDLASLIDEIKWKLDLCVKYYDGL